MFKALALSLFIISSALVHAQSDCSSLMRSLMNRSNSAHSSQVAELRALQNYAKNLEIPEDIIVQIEKSYELVFEGQPLERNQNWLLYVATLAPENQQEAMHLIASGDTSAKAIKKFEKIEKRIAKKRASFEEKAIKRLQKEQPDKPMAQIVEQAKAQTHEFMNSYRKLSFECRSQTPNATRKKASSTFKKFTIGIGLASSLGTMAYVNRDREIEDWIGQFGYETVMGIVSGTIASKILTNPRSSHISKSIKKYFFSRTIGLVDMALFGMIFGADGDEAQARLDEVLSDPQKAERLRELQAVFEEERLYQRVRQKFVEGLKKVKETIGLENPPPIDLGVDWGALTAEDLEREDVQDVLLAAAISELYSEGAGENITTGNVGADRYTFHAAYGLVMLPRNMAISVWIYNVLCLGQNNPRAALLKAVAIYTIDSVVGNQLYYLVRRNAINQ